MAKYLKTILLCIITAALVLTMFTGLTFADETISGDGAALKGTIKVGHLLDLSGEGKLTGDIAHEAFTFACDYIEKTTGWKIEVVEGDCQSDGTTAANQAEQLISQGCQVIFGPTQTGHKKAVLAYVADNNIPVVLYNESLGAFTGGFLFGNDMIVAEGGGTAGFPTVMADYIYNVLGYRTVICFKQDTVNGYNYVDPFITCFQGMGGNVIDNFAIARRTDDWSEYLAAMINSDAEAIVGWTSSSDAVNFFNAWYNSGAYEKIPVFAAAHDGFSDSYIMDELDSKIVDALIDKGFCAPINYAYSIDNDYNNSYVAAYTDAVGHHPIGSSLAGSCCQALLCLTTALDNLGVSDPTTLSAADLAAAMRAAEFDGPEGHTVFENGTVVAKKNVYVANVVRLDDGSCNYEIQMTYEQVPSDGYNYDAMNGAYIGTSPEIIAAGWQKIDGTWYYFKDSGKMATGWQKIDGTWYRFTSFGAMLTDWQFINDTWYFLKDSGAMATGWQKIGGTWYYFKDSGAMVTGWQYIDNEWYFFSDSGAMYSAAWLKWKDKWYFLHGSGPMAVGWHLLYGKWYYFDGSGVMATGWRQIGGTWYYLRSSGEMATGWEKVDGKWYYLYPSGAMATGWVQDGGKWYFCSPSGDMQTGWLLRGNTWYYLTGSGDMVTHWYRVGSKWYFFNNSGAMQERHVDVSGYNNPTDRFLYSTTDIDSMIFVVGDGNPGQSAKIYYYEKKSGEWKRRLADTAWYGYNGFSDSTYEGDATTPVGCFELGTAFGNKANPGTSVKWVDVNEHHYWVDDVTSRYYNQLIDDREVPDGWNSGEHLIDYKEGYAYAVNIEVNPPYITSAIFLHCNGGSTFTHGCVGTSEESMTWILKHIKDDTRIVIVEEEEDLDDLNAEGYWY